MKDYTGQKYGRLTFLHFVEKDDYGKPLWRVRCDCGTEFDVKVESVKNGQTKSCGCLRKEKSRERIMQYNLWRKQNSARSSSQNWKRLG